MTPVGQALTQDQIATLSKAGVIPGNTPAAQVQIFAQVCKELSLSPFSREIYLLFIGGKYCPVVGIGGLRRIAAKSGQFAGSDDIKFDVQADGSFKTAAQMIQAGQLPKTATSTVYRIVAGLRVPFTATVAFTEFNKNSGNWKTMPWQMIGKVAEAFAIRKGFSDYGVSGVFVEEEDHAIDVTQKSNNNAIDSLRAQAFELLETAQMEDNKFEAANQAIYEANDKGQLVSIITRLRDYQPNNDPAQQFGQMENALNGTDKRVATPTKNQ